MLDSVLNIPEDYLSTFAVVIRGIQRKVDIWQTDYSIHSKLRTFYKTTFYNFYNFLQPRTFYNFYKTIGLFLYCQYVVKILRELFSTLSSNISKKIVFSAQINLVFVHLTHVKTNYYQSFMIYMLILIKIQLLK